MLWTGPGNSTQAIDFVKQPCHGVMEGTAKQSGWNIAGYNSGLQNFRTLNLIKADKTFANQGYLLRCMPCRGKMAAFMPRWKSTVMKARQT
jgi:hypothetical protein